MNKYNTIQYIYIYIYICIYIKEKEGSLICVYSTKILRLQKSTTAVTAATNGLYKVRGN